MQALKNKIWGRSGDSNTTTTTPATPPQVPPQKCIEQSAERHLSLIVSHLLTHEKLHKFWSPVILNFAKDVCNTIQINVKTGDKMDICNYVKVKKIPGGTITDCKCINGVVITKNVTHKKMRTKLDNPRILLLSGSLEYKGDKAGADSPSDDEKKYFKTLTSQIAVLNPDLIIVEKEAAKNAQDFILESNIALVTGIKPLSLEKLYRQLQIKPFTDPLAQYFPLGGVGTCGTFNVHRHNGSWGEKTHMHLEKCPKELGCTIIVRGGTLAELAKVKAILLFSIYSAYNLRLEGRLLLDANATFPPPIDRTLDLATLSCSSEVFFSEPPLPARLRHPSINNYAPTATRFFSLHKRDKSLLSTSFQSPHTHFSFEDDDPFKSLLTHTTLPTCTCSHPYSHSVPPPPALPVIPPSPRAAREKRVRGKSTDTPAPAGDTEPLATKTTQTLAYVHSLFCTATSTVCIQHELHAIDFYSANDMTLGEFLETMCFNLATTCHAKECNHKMLQHRRSFHHGSARLNVGVEMREKPVVDSPGIHLSSYCKICNSPSPITPMSTETWSYSFGKFLELFFYCSRAINQSAKCRHSIFRDHVHYFYSSNFVAQFSTEPIPRLHVMLPPIPLMYDTNVTTKSPEAENNVLVYENEPSSIIANSLSSSDFKERYEQYYKEEKIAQATTVPATRPRSRSRSLGPSPVVSRTRAQTTVPLPAEAPVLPKPVIPTIPEQTDLGQPVSQTDTIRDPVMMYLLCEDKREITTRFNVKKEPVACTTYYPLQFRAMRELMAEGGEARFIESLSRCKSWKATGGKSGASFIKTLDGRYILKEIKPVEFLYFIDTAHHYFGYLANAFSQKAPTLLAKIFGVYTVNWKNKDHHLIVMENLQYGCTNVQMYDLKGSTCGRFVENPTSGDCLLDENLLQTTFAAPICTTEFSKTILGQAVWNDSAFLSSLEVMDYSLLVGIGKDGELVLGIIDYLRCFTWDKRAENVLKVLIRGREPTIIEPELYKARFREAMWTYFVMLPTKFTKVHHPPL